MKERRKADIFQSKCLTEMRVCKVVSWEIVARQHEIETRIKWWKLKKEKCKEFREECRRLWLVGKSYQMMGKAEVMRE